MTDYNQLCSDFVKKTCIDRDESHGHHHMQTVFNNSLQICLGEDITDPNIIKLVSIVAWLHDVADHKYDKNGQLEQLVKDFLTTNFQPDAELIWNIITRISYSKEIKSKADWELVLGSEGILIRNIVSDADKLEAIGKIGIERCIQYGAEHHRHKYNEEAPRELLLKHVNEHAKEKLLLLKDHFIYTSTGKKMAEPLHNEMVLELELLNKQI